MAGRTNWESLPPSRTPPARMTSEPRPWDGQQIFKETRKMKQQNDDSAFFERPAPAHPTPWTSTKKAPMQRDPSPVASGGTDGRRTGTLLWFNALRGFGFIENDAGGPNVFLHALNISGD